MSILNKSSLVMIPSGYKEDKLYSVKPRNGDGDFTFTRASTGTRVNADGYIEEVPWNMLQYSEDYTQWLKSSNTTLVGSQTSPINTSTAYALQHNGTTAEYWIQKPSIPLPSANVTVSAYLKKGTKNWIVFRVGNICLQYFDIENEVLGNNIFGDPISYNFVDAGNDWVRLDMTVLGNGGNNGIQIYSAESGSSGQTTGTSGDLLLYVWGVQLVKGNAPKTYIKTTDRLDIPRLDYSGGATNATLLLEPQRTNLVTYSEDLDSNTKLNVVVTSNDIISPDGTQNADKLETTSNNSYKLLKTNSISFVSGNDYTFSFFAKKGTTDFIQLITTNTLFGATSEWANFDLNNGVVSLDNYGGASIEDYGNGWYRCQMISTCVSSGTDGWFVSVITSGTSARAEYTTSVVDVYVWGAMAETGSFPTSYIPTSGTSTTRNEDFSEDAGDATIFNDSEGVLFVEVAALADAINNRTISLSDGTNNNTISLRYTSTSNQLQAFIYNGGVVQFNTSVTLSDVTNYNKIAIKYKDNDCALYVNGTEEATDTSATMPTGLSQFSFTRPDGVNRFHGKCKQAMVFNQALTNEELETLTT